MKTTPAINPAKMAAFKKCLFIINGFSVLFSRTPGKILTMIFVH
jgi:hypothetical protein